MPSDANTKAPGVYIIVTEWKPAGFQESLS
jgi:hypothetical protein